MTLEARAASLSREDVVSLLVSHEDLLTSHQELTDSHRDLAASYQELTTRAAALERQLEWLKRQVFGSKSERRVGPDGRQLALGELVIPGVSAPVPTATVRGYSRRPARKPWEDGEEPSGLRFDPSVPVRVIEVPTPELEGMSADAYAVIGEKVTERLAQRPASYEVLRYVRKVVKLKDEGRLVCAPAPPAVLERSGADVSLLAMLVIEKFVYHLPLYRQHQRMEAAGVHLSRATLTHWVHGTAELLEPIFRAQWESVLKSQVLAMDETPIKAGYRKAERKMGTGYFWPVYGDQDEIVFPFSTSRGIAVIRESLKGFSGVMLTDGYDPYGRYVKQVNGVVHAQCWAHARRYFVEAESAEPALCAEALEQIRALYEHEDTLRKKGVSGEQKLLYRAEHEKPIVDRFFEWLRETFEQRILLPTSPFTVAANYALERETSLKVFLQYPDVPVDNNHLEREIRPIAVGRKNWLFCWTEVGARYVGILQSLLATCRLQGVDPYTYLVDVLQRIDTHPAHEVRLLTPRLWKQHFSQNPLRSAIDRPRSP
jgi:transposase